MIYQKALASFFANYCRFLNVDLSVSLLDKSDRYNGRDIDALIVFQDSFIFLIETRGLSSVESNEDRAQLMARINTMVADYTTIHRDVPSFMDCNKIYNILIDSDFFAQVFLENTLIDYITKYSISSKDFFQKVKGIDINEEVRKKFKYSDENSIILVQAILEINNAFSHILASLKNNDDDALKNIEKARSHIYRATLDHYKMLIRLVYTQKNHTVNETITKKFQELRFKEFELIGTGIEKKVFLHGDKEENILTHYKETFNEMMMNDS